MSKQCVWLRRLCANMNPGWPTGQAPPGPTPWLTVSCSCRDRNGLWSCQGSEAVSGDWRSRLSSPLAGRVEIKIIKPLIWIYHSSTATVAKVQRCIRLYRDRSRPLAMTWLMSCTYHCISSAYYSKIPVIAMVFISLLLARQITTHWSVWSNYRVRVMRVRFF